MVGGGSSELDILIFTPVYRLEPETVQALLALEWDGPLSMLYQKDNPFQTGNAREDGVANHFHQYIRGRDTFLRGWWDAMLIIESDIIPPPDTLKRLAALECDVAYGVYVFRNQQNPVVNVFERYRDKGNPPRPARNMGESLSTRNGSRGTLWQEALEAGVVKVSGAAFGCVLVKRHVLEAVPMRLEGRGHCDTPWTVDVYQAGYSMLADTRVLCGHKDTDGTILWPPGTETRRSGEGVN